MATKRMTKKAVITGENEVLWNVLYHEDGELVARSAWYESEQEVDEFIATLNNEKGK